MQEQPIEPGAGRRTLADGIDDLLVREEPLWIEVHGDRLLTMRTPGRDRDLALGFLLSEGVLDNLSLVASTEFAAGDPTALRPDTLRVNLSDPSRARTAGRLTRTHEIRPSCGICGLIDVDQMLEELPPLLPGVPQIGPGAIDRFRGGFAANQPLFAATGASHGAVLFDAQGEVLGHGEDVGRHNALDKAIGMAAAAGRPLTHTIAMLSGRAGFDLVLKCLRVRIPVILSVSAPSALAFDLCRSAGATLIGFVRDDRAQVYSDPGRLVPS